MLIFGRALKDDEGTDFYAQERVDDQICVVSRALHDTLTAPVAKLAHSPPQIEA